ncbi:MAG: FAD-dependent oxidoreductase [Rubellimicrobium sp.]|nr:FAD-dependent oxidoreductase [Rubellimicrobium sp.]
MTDEVDVIVVGAGVAGLSAATELGRLGLTCAVIEAADRIGGRAHTREIAPGVWFDLGCAWLVDGEANPFTRIADRLGIPLVRDRKADFTLARHRFHRNGAALSPEDRRACLAYFDACERAIAQAADAGRDIAVAQVVDTDTPFATPFKGYLGAAWGQDIDLISTVDYASSEGSNDYRLLSGLGNLVATWAKGIDVRLNAPARRIDWSGGGPGKAVTVETPQGTLAGRHVLITVSTGLLASGEISFTPDLPDWKLAAVEGLPMGTENKVGLHFDRDVFGPEGRAYYTSWADGAVPAKVDAGVVGQDMAVVLFGGRHAVALEQEGPAALGAFALDRVADIFGANIRRHLTRAFPTAWSTDRWTLGSWSCAAPGQAHQRAALARPVDERLFFAGEATSIGGQGTCHGAFATGVRAAQEIASLRQDGRDAAPPAAAVPEDGRPG